MIEDIEVAGRTAWFARPKQAAGEAAVVHGAVVVCHGGGGPRAARASGDREARGARLRGGRAGSVRREAVDRDDQGTGRRSSGAAGARARSGRLDPRERGRRRGPARIAVIGYCFGGTAALEAARSGADIACAVSFHGGLAAPEPPAKIHARVLACCGGADPHCPPAQRAAFEAEMTAAGADWQLHVHGGALHAFTVRDSEKIPAARTTSAPIGGRGARCSRSSTRRSVPDMAS